MSKSRADEWKFDKSYDFYTDLGMRESSGLHGKENPGTSYIGLYQMGETALTDAGYYTKNPAAGKDRPSYNNDWSGTWTGKNGINSKEDFLVNREAQDIAVREYHDKVWGYIGDHQKYEGQTIGDITLTKAGMIAAAHLVGAGELKNFINSNGTNNSQDKFGTKCSEYLKGFSDKQYKVDYSTANLRAAYQQSHPELANKNSSNVTAAQAPQQAASDGTYKVQGGDNLTAIAQKHNMSLEQLLAIPGNEQYKANPSAI